MDPMPPINKVFALISQKEHQRKVNQPVHSVSEATGSMAFVVRSNTAGQYFQHSVPVSGGHKRQKKDRPSYTHCKFLGHNIDRCNKIHGYPPNYKSKSKESSATIMHQPSSAAVHQISATNSNSDQSSSFGGFVQNLKPNQYQQLLSLFSQHLTASVATSLVPAVASTNSQSGSAYQEDDWQG
ncbi:hypothetical protein ACOSQ2_013125 [Xanthoceras sorbifolium]